MGAPAVASYLGVTLRTVYAIFVEGQWPERAWRGGSDLQSPATARAVRVLPQVHNLRLEINERPRAFLEGWFGARQRDQCLRCGGHRGAT